MKAIVLFLLFAGVLLVMHAVYAQKVAAAESKTRVTYKFIPRTYLEEQLSGNAEVSSKLKGLFKDPWPGVRPNMPTDVGAFRATRRELPE